MVKPLDETDRKIIEGIRAGKSYEEIAKIIFISVSGIKKRVRLIKERNGCNKLPELIGKIIE